MSSYKDGWIYGGPGDDTITIQQVDLSNGNSGSLEIYGGSGADTFIIEKGITGENRFPTDKYIYDFDFFEGDRIKFVDEKGASVQPVSFQLGDIVGVSADLIYGGNRISSVSWGTINLTGTAINGDYFI